MVCCKRLPHVSMMELMVWKRHQRGWNIKCLPVVLPPNFGNVGSFLGNGLALAPKGLRSERDAGDWVAEPRCKSSSSWLWALPASLLGKAGLIEKWCNVPHWSHLLCSRGPGLPRKWEHRLVLSCWTHRVISALTHLSTDSLLFLFKLRIVLRTQICTIQ